MHKTCSLYTSNPTHLSKEIPLYQGCIKSCIKGSDSFYVVSDNVFYGNCLNIVQTAKELLYISVVLSVL